MALRTELLLATALASVAPFSVSAAYAQQAFDWTGFYAGIAAGTISNNSAGYLDGPWTYDFPLHGFGGVVGITGGVNLQTDKSFYGFETDFLLTNLTSTYEEDYGEGDHFRVQTTLDKLVTARLRAGFVPNDNVLIYATGGLAAGNVGATTSMQDFGKAASGSVTHQWLPGIVLGAGFEWAFKENASLKFDGLYYQLSDFTVSATGDRFADYTITTHPQGFIVRTGLNWLF